MTVSAPGRREASDRGPFGRALERPLRLLGLGHSWMALLTPKAYNAYLLMLRFPGLQLVVVNDPEWVMRILVTSADQYPKHPLMHETLMPLVGGSPFATNGEHWRRERNHLNQALSNARLSMVHPLMHSGCEAMLDRLAGGDELQEVEVDSLMTAVTADIILRAIFSQALPERQAQEIAADFERYQRWSQRVLVLRLLGLPSLGLQTWRKRIAQRIRGALSECMSCHTGRTDLLASLKEAYGPGHETAILDQISMLFLAGHETSASALSWAIYLLGQDQPLQQALRAEADTNLNLGHGAPREPVRSEDHPLVTGFLREVLRLFPPVGYFPRQALEDQEIRGVTVRKGAAILVSPWLMHRHNRWWSSPDEFDWQRFNQAPLKGTYLPFGMGPRACPGAAFAMQESVLILVSLLHHYRIEPLADHVPQVVGRLTVRSANGIRVRLARRQDV
jgi:cytochrome P450